MKKILFLVLIATTGFAFAAAPVPTKAPTKTPAKTAQPPKEAEREIPYPELGHFINQRVIVHSNLGTVRSGKLTHYSQTQIGIDLDGSGVQFTFERDSIKSVGVPIAPEETQSADSAKKN
jgi:hypothetical protein